MILRDYQSLAADHAVDAIQQGKRICYAAPTGCGKSLIEIHIQSQCPGAWIVTPNNNILTGFLSKLGHDTSDKSEQWTIDTGYAHHISTPVRLRNALLAGEMESPAALIIDEGHHDLAETYQQLHALCGYCPAVLFTASPYRGTPKGTTAFREQWGEPVWVITYPEAAARGDISIPTISIVPLVDDDLLEVKDGDFVVSQITSATRDKFEHIASIAKRFYSNQWDKPTMFSCPNTDICFTLTAALNRAGCPSVSVTGDTEHKDRQRAFADCISRRCALLQVYVVSEGVDLPIQRLIDLSPTISPVKWIQQFGRITRPSLASEYICTNRNFLRHHYLLDGCVPTSATKDAIQAFGGLGTRLAVRAMGVESLGRLKPITLPLKDGIKAACYSVAGIEGNRCIEYFVIIHPAREEVFWARRENVKLANGQKSYGNWTRCEQPSELVGFNSLPTSPLSDKQRDWWSKAAGRYGLDASASITRKEFPALPVLSQTRYSLC